jgi:hypothetical protein
MEVSIMLPPHILQLSIEIDQSSTTKKQKHLVWSGPKEHPMLQDSAQDCWRSGVPTFLQPNSRMPFCIIQNFLG